MTATLPTGAWVRALWPGIAALVAVMGIGRFVYTPILPDMLAAGALTLREAGWVASANFVGYLVGAMAASRIHGPAAQSALARAGLAATVVTLAAMAATDGLAAWMALRFASGVASAFALVFVSTQVLARLTAIGAADRTIALYGGVGIGIAASAALTQAVHATDGSWRAAWAVSAVLAAVFAAAAWRGAGWRPGPGGARAATGAAAAASTAEAAGTAGAADTIAPDPTGRRAFLAVVLAYGLFGLGYVIHATYLPAMVRAAGYPPSAAAWIWVLVGLASLPSIAAWRAVARRFGARAAIAGCYAVEGATALVPLAGDSIAWAAVAAFGLGATFIPVTGLALPFARGLDPANAARAIGTMTAAFGAGQIVGPVAAAYLADGRGFGGPSVLACVALLAAAALMAPRLGARE
jgi:MFS family permease